VANTFEEQAQDRFQKSSAFLNKAQTLLQDDLVARTVLADAVSAIKNALQGYLLVKVGRSPSHPETHHLLEVAASNSMPDLINACIDTGLDIRPIARDIRRLNDERNRRTHDDPQRRIDPAQARSALDLARTVAQRVNASIKGAASPVAVPRVVPEAAATGRVPLHNSRGPGYAAVAARAVPAASKTVEPEPEQTLAAAAQAPAPAQSMPGATSEKSVAAGVPALESGEDEETPASDDTGIFVALTPRADRRRAALGRGLVAAGLLAVGAAAGIGLAIPLAHGSTTGWLSFAQRWYASAPTYVTPTPTPLPVLMPSTVPQNTGNLTLAAPVCAAGRAILALQNTGRAPLPWAMGVPMGKGTATFAFTPAALGQSTALGTLAPQARTTVYVASAGTTPYRVVVLAPGGALQVVAPAC
jgi:hypothetical protein